MDVPVSQLQGRIRAVEAVLSQNGQSGGILPDVLKNIDDSTGTITVNSDLHIAQTLFGSAGVITAGDSINVAAGQQVVVGNLTSSADFAGQSMHATGQVAADGGVTIGSGNQVNVGGSGSSASFAGDSMHLSGVASADAGFNASGNFVVSSAGAINPCASMHCVGSVTIDSNLVVGGGITATQVLTSGKVAAGGSASGADVSGGNCHFTSTSQFDGAMTAAGITAASLHASGVVKADAGFQGPAVGGFPIVGTFVVTPGGGGVGALNASTTLVSLLNNLAGALT